MGKVITNLVQHVGVCPHHVNVIAVRCEFMRKERDESLCLYGKLSSLSQVSGVGGSWKIISFVQGIWQRCHLYRDGITIMLVAQGGYNTHASCTTKVLQTCWMYQEDNNHVSCTSKAEQHRLSHFPDLSLSKTLVIYAIKRDHLQHQSGEEEQKIWHGWLAAGINGAAGTPAARAQGQ